MDRFRENKPQNQQERKRSFNAQDIAKDLESCDIADPVDASQKLDLILSLNDDSLHININFTNHPISFDLYQAYNYAKDLIDRNVIPKSLPWFTALQDKMLTMGVFIADANFDKNYEGKITESKLESQRREVMFQKWLWQKKITQDNWANLNPLLQKDLLRDFSKWYKDQETSK